MSQSSMMFGMSQKIVFVSVVFLSADYILDISGMSEVEVDSFPSSYQPISRV